MIEITGTVVGVEAVQTRFATASQTVRDRVRQAVQRGGLRVLATVKQKLSGEVLNVRSGRLRRSANEETTVSGDTVTSTVGTPVVYARPHELGFRGIEQVKQYIRTTDTVFGRRVATPLQMVVRAHSRSVNMPARPFLVPSLNENRTAIIAEINAAAGGA